MSNHEPANNRRGRGVVRDYDEAGVVEMNTVIMSIPINHNVVGTCGKCGGPIISPMIFTCTDTGCGAPEWCANCGAIPKQLVNPYYGPIREMQ